MKRDLARRLGWLFAAGFLLTLAPRTVQADSCTFVLGFAQLAALDPVQIGQCVDDQRFDADRAQALQHTTTGLLVWDKASNESSFTNGRETLVLTRYGLAARTNDQRFWFEPNPDGLPTVYGNAVVDVSVEQGGTGAVVTDFTLAQSVPLQVSLRGGGFNPGEPIAIDWTFTPYYNLPNASGQAYHVDRRACPDIRLPGSTETA